MKHNVPACCSYQDLPLRKEHRHSSISGSSVLYWISYIVGTVSTILITGCTVFCCYLALTML